MERRVISVAKEFSRYPAGRYQSDGPYSGEAFREKFLIPAVRSGATIVVDLEGARGYGSSFLEEAFGGLVRKGFPSAEILERISFQSQDGSLIQEIKDYIREARAPGES